MRSATVFTHNMSSDSPLIGPRHWAVRLYIPISTVTRPLWSRCFVLLYLAFRSFTSAALIMATLPFALVGGFWLLFLLGYNLSIASAIGFIALAGVSAEFGIVMLIYLDHAIQKRRASNKFSTEQDLMEAIEEGAVLRVRPKAMTAAVIVAGLLPIMLGGGTGSEVMRRIAAPMVGGMITAPFLSMLVLPAAYLLLHRRELRHSASPIGA